MENVKLMKNNLFKDKFVVFIYIMYLMKLLSSLFIVFSNKKKLNGNECITFTIGEGTGCQFMCDHCYQNLGTDRFYFTDWICQNKDGICTGDPTPWETYTCCTED